MSRCRALSGSMTMATALFLLTTSTAAMDDARYNLASVQPSKQVRVAAGGEGRAAIYFYNIDGNRTTHVSLRVSSAPPGWDVRVEPEERAVTLEGGGDLVENLRVEPSPLLAEAAREVPEGSVSVAIPTRGYTVARVAQVVVRAPESAQPGERAEIQVSADASWPGQAGASAIRQGRDFDFVAEVVPGSGSIAHIVPGDGAAPAQAGAPERAGAPGPAEAPEGVAEPGERGFDLAAFVDRWMPAILALIIVIAGSIVIPTLTARKVRAARDSPPPRKPEAP